MPFTRLSPIHQELIKIRGQLRLSHFDQLTASRLNTGIRKMVVFPHGIYTITYKRRSKKKGGTLEGSLQKGRRIDGRNITRAVSLGKVGQITKERLLAASHKLEQKFSHFRTHSPQLVFSN